jgi:hypothetical protein
MIGPGGTSVLHTPEGGSARQLINKTGAISKKGTLVEAGTAIDHSVQNVSADDPDCIGVIYEDGIADGELVWVVTHGIGDVLLEDGSASTRGYWARVSVTQAGRADITLPNPPGGTIVEIDNHFREVGHCLQSVSSGTDKLARILLHFN